MADPTLMSDTAGSTTVVVVVVIVVTGSNFCLLHLSDEIMEMMHYSHGGARHHSVEFSTGAEP